MADMALATSGIALVVLVWVSVLRTTLVSRRSPSAGARWTTRVCSAAGAAVARRVPPRWADRVTAWCGAAGLFATAAAWLTGLAVGFGLLLAAFRAPGPASADWVTVAFVAAAAASALVAAAAFSVHLNRFLAGYDRREGMIARSLGQVRQVTDSDALVSNYLRSGSRDTLDGYFAEWTGWFADLQLTHVTFPGLVYHRSAGRLPWTDAAVVVLDAAALVESVAPRWAPLHARVLIDVGSHCLQRLAHQAGIVVPAITVSLQGREEREFCDTVQLAVSAGLPAERDADMAWRFFQEIRVRYAPYAALIGTRVPGP